MNLETKSLRPHEFLEYAGRFVAGSYLYAILDTCDAPLVSAKVHDLGTERSLCIYDPPWEAKFSAVAPYLASVDESLLDWISATLGKDPWGVFVISSAERNILRSHLRDLLTVESPEREKLYFRYYDPRVLRNFVATCVDSQLDQLFGPIRAFAVNYPEENPTVFARR